MIHLGVPRKRNWTLWIPINSTQHHSDPALSRNDQENNTTNAFHCGSKREKARGKGGPTTEAGRRRQAEAEAAKAAKIERKRERNRKKNFSKRIKKLDQSERPRWWYSDGQVPKGFERFAEAREEQRAKEAKDKAARKKREKSKQSKDSHCVSRNGQAGCAAPRTKALWENDVRIARLRGDTAMMRRLFEEELERAGEENMGAKAVTTRFRALSLRFHPDKHSGEGASTVASYATAFQALSAAHASVKEGFF